MSAILSRITTPGGMSNYEHSAGSELKQYYEQIYTAGVQEWILLPDCLYPVAVAINFQTGGGGATLEATWSPPSTLGIISSQGSVWPTGPQQPANYGGPFIIPWAFSIDGTDIYVLTGPSYTLVQGPTAIRLNVQSGTATISVRA